MVTLQRSYLKNHFQGFGRCYWILGKIFKKQVHPLGNKEKHQGNLTPLEIMIVWQLTGKVGNSNRKYNRCQDHENAKIKKEMKIGRQGGKKGEKEEGREQVSREDSREVVCRKATSKSLNNRRIQEGIRLFWYHIESQDTEKHRKHLCPYLPPTPNGDDILQELCQGSHKGHSRGIWS